MKKLGNILKSFLEEDETNNDVTTQRTQQNKVEVNSSDIESIFQQLVTIASEGLTIEFDAEHVADLESVANTIFGLSDELKNKIEELKQ